VEPSAGLIEGLLLRTDPTISVSDGQVLNQGAKPWARLEQELCLKAVSIQWGTGVKEGIFGIPPALHPLVSELFWPVQKQGGKISLQFLMQPHHLHFAKGIVVMSTKAFLPVTQPHTTLNLSAAEAK